MRQIKFRVWDEEDKIMFSPATLEVIVDNILEVIVDNIDMGLPVNITGWGCDGDNMGNRDRFVWLQYTGLHDKNEKEIFEGDLVRAGVLAKVIFENGCFVLEKEGFPKGVTVYDIKKMIDIEVVGNIYENPELLTN